MLIFREVYRRHHRNVSERAAKNCEEEGPACSSSRSRWGANVKVAMENIRRHPLQIVDVESLLKVKGVGPKIADIVKSNVFALYPPEKPTGTEKLTHTKKSAPKKKDAREKDLSKTAASNENKTTKGHKDYIPKLGTANYAFLIVLYREQHGRNQREYLTKEELMNAAEDSCLSEKPIFTEGNNSQRNLGSRCHRSFYNGWSSFKSLVNNNLAYSWGNPKKISLTIKGTCIAERLYKDAVSRGKIEQDFCIKDHARSQGGEDDVHGERELASGTSSDEDFGMSSLMDRIEKRLTIQKLVDVSKSYSNSQNILHEHAEEKLARKPSLAAQQNKDVVSDEISSFLDPPDSNASPISVRSTNQRDNTVSLISSDFSVRGNVKQPDTIAPSVGTRLPPLCTGQSFSEEYDVILLIDGREKYFNRRSNSSSLDAHLNRIRQQGCFVEIRTLPIGDALWIARHKSHPHEEYILDYIIERKGLDDLISSVKDSGRYYSQKYRLRHCGLRNLYYVVEGDIEAISSSSDYKLVCTVCAKVSVIDGFNVLRTRSVADTLKLYKRMSDSITALYNIQSLSCRESDQSTQETSLSFTLFESQCKQFEKDSIKLQDIWATMLNEVPRLGPEACSSIVQAYPTPLSLWNALKSHRGTKDEILASIPLRKSTGRNATIGSCKSKSVIDSLFFS